jgi:putative transposase
MARAKRHYIPGHIWYITHRCHKRECLLKFSKDRRRWLQWLYEARQRYSLTILNYMATSNHIHLLVVDDGAREIIPRSIQLIAGRTGQEYNQKKSQGSILEGPIPRNSNRRRRASFHCIVYVDLNIVHAGIVDHPSQWLFCSYNEIQNPRRKNALINYDKLRELVDVETYDQVKHYHKGWVEEYVGDGGNRREEKWAKSIVVGSKAFVEIVKTLLGALARGRKVREVETFMTNNQ